jgi:sporulation protein YlmC with PRC-barrel domain
MLVKKLLGKEVISSQGNKIGKIADLEIDLVSAKVNNAVISAGFNKKYKIKLEDIITASDTVIIRLSENDLKKAAEKPKKQLRS